MIARRVLISLVAVLFLIPVVNTHAQERLCDTAFEDCRAPLWQLIDAETQGIDVAFWFMQDSSYATKIINRFRAGVPVRVLVDPRANPTYAGNEAVLTMLRDAGIPMRYKLTDGILHWKLMLFAGQNKLEFSGANFSGNFFVPDVPNSNYIDEAIYFTSDLSLIQSFKTKFDDVWTNSLDYGDYANITGPLTRRYPTFPINPELNFPPTADWSQDFLTRTQQSLNAETQKIDIIMYRITNLGYADTTIAAVNRGIAVRLIHEPEEYRNPARQWDSWNVDRMYMGGVQIKMRKHLGLNHQKSVLLYGQGMTIFGSSNWTGPSSNYQQEHNYFTTQSWFFQWFVNQFERKWNSPTENEPFTPLPPTLPSYASPANAAIAQPTNIKLEWEGGPWAHKYDIYFGTSPTPPLYLANVSTYQSGAQLGQPLLDSGSVDNGQPEVFTVPDLLQPNTKYYWRIVSKTMANVSVTGPTWSFTTLGSSQPPSAPSGLTATATSATKVDLQWNDVSGETGYSLERSPDGTTGWAEIANLAAGQLTYSDLQVVAQTTYFYRVKAYNSGGFSSPSNTVSVTTPQPPQPSANDVVLWAGEAPVKVGWSVVSDATAAGGSRISNPDAGAPKIPAALANPASYFEMSFPAQAGVDYRIWLRGKAQADFWGNDSVFIQFSDSVTNTGTPTYRIGTTSATEYNLEDCSGCGEQGWGWQDNGWGVGVFGPLIRFAASGTHTVRIQVREDGLSLDQIVLSPQTYLAVAPGPLKNDNTILPKTGATTPPPTINSINPSSGSTAGGTSVTVSGGGFVAGTTVTLGGSALANLVVVNANSITGSTPAHSAGLVNVVVTNPDAQFATLTNGYNYQTPVAPPTITGITPNFGTTAGGTSVSISGSGFVAGATVSLGGAAVTSVVVVNSTTITGSTPAHAAGAVNVVVTNPNGQAATLNNGYTYQTPVPAPTVTSVTPNSGSAIGGTSITISGTGFLSGATVSLGGTAASNVNVVNSTSLTATTAAHATGTVNVVVTNTDGQSGTLLNGFTYTTAPQPVPAFGKVFVVVAENQSYESVIGNSQMPYLNTLVARHGLATNYYANTHPSIGNYFWMTTGQVITNDSNFAGTVTQDNIVRQFAVSGKSWKSYAESLPSVGYTGGDQYPYVKRHNPFAYFSDVLGNQSQANNIVPFSQFSNDLLNNQLPNFSFIIPNQYNNAHDCPQSIPSCTNADKLAALDNWLRNQIDPLLASSAFTQDGLVIVVFDESVNADTVNGGGHIAMVVLSPKAKQGYQANTFYQHQSALRLILEGLGVSGHPGASANAPNMAEFFGSTPNSAPAISSVTPSLGPTAGGTSVTISGTGFASGATVRFGGTTASSVTVIGSTTITATSPPHASGAVDVQVTNPSSESAVRVSGFTYVAPLPPPVVNSITPNSGTTAGGTNVSIGGSQFSAGATVRIGGLPATNVVVTNSTTITAKTPAHSAGLANVVVTNSDGQSGTLTNGFTFVTPPQGETILLADDFNDSSLDTTRWSTNNLWSGFTDPTVAIVETQSLDIGPLKQNVDASHYNGIASVGSFDFAGGYAYVQIVQGPNVNTAADGFFSIGSTVDNCYRIYVEGGLLTLQSKLAGVKRTLLTTAFNSTNHAFWRIRHDTISGSVVFEAAPNNNGVPGTWQLLYNEAWNTSAVPLASVRFELKAGTWKTEAAAPGTVKFDNFKAAKP
jgi:hypothetical protein